jgi:hypothetical protein
LRRNIRGSIIEGSRAVTYKECLGKIQYLICQRHRTERRRHDWRRHSEEVWIH